MTSTPPEAKPSALSREEEGLVRYLETAGVNNSFGRQGATIIRRLDRELCEREDAPTIGRLNQMIDERDARIAEAVKALRESKVTATSPLASAALTNSVAGICAIHDIADRLEGSKK